MVFTTVWVLWILNVALYPWLHIYNIKRLSTHNVQMEIIQNLKVSPVQSRLSINNVQMTIIQKVCNLLVDIKQHVFR